MSILYLTPGVFDKGGISRYCRFQIQALRDYMGEDSVRVMSLLGYCPGDFDDPIVVDWAGTTPPTFRSRAAFSLVSAQNALTSRPQMVLAALINLGPLAWLLARSLGAELAMNIYGWEVWSHIKRPRKMSLAASDYVISDCYNTADHAFAERLVSSKPSVVWDCVDTARYTPGEPDWRRLEKYGLRPTARFRILYLSRLSEHAIYKGIYRLFDVVRALGDGFELAVAGSGDMADEFQRKARDMGLGERCVFTGSVDEADMPDVYRTGDAFYLVSEVGRGKGEGIPLTPLEALSCGVPVLVGNDDGSRETLVGQGGICINHTEFDRQVKYLSRLRSDGDFHRAEQKHARERALAAFGYERFARETVAALNIQGRKG